MTRPLTVPLALALATCQPGPSSVEPKSPEPEPKPGHADGLRLVQSDGSWYVTGMSPDAASMVEQGRLFAALHPIKGTPDLRAVAVLKTLGPAVGSSVQVAPQCIAPPATLAAAISIKPLAFNTEEKVGPCLARVVDTGTDERGEAYVLLNVGAGVGVEPGDQYVLLGKAVVADGNTPLALDTDHDGLCQVPANPMHLKPSTARCVVIKNLPDRKELKNTFAAWMPRASP